MSKSIRRGLRLIETAMADWATTARLVVLVTVLTLAAIALLLAGWGLYVPQDPRVSSV